jgi:hypothetical protein
VALDRRSAEVTPARCGAVRCGQVEAAWEAEKPKLQPLPEFGEIFDAEVSRPVSPYCPVSFVRRRYSVPFA